MCLNNKTFSVFAIHILETNSDFDTTKGLEILHSKFNIITNIKKLRKVLIVAEVRVSCLLLYSVGLYIIL